MIFSSFPQTAKAGSAITAAPTSAVKSSASSRRAVNGFAAVARWPVRVDARMRHSDHRQHRPHPRGPWLRLDRYS
jgi:hypothetical protein